MKGRTLIAAFLAFVLAGPLFAASPSQAVVMREGVVELSREEVAPLVTAAIEDARYAALQQVAQSRKLRLDPNQAKALTYPEGYTAVFVPAFNEQGSEGGFLASSEDSWTLAIDTVSEKGRLVEGFAARLVGKKVVIDAHVKPQVSDEEHTAQSPVIMATYSTFCQYVSSYSVNFGCWSLPDNPFGYYYTTVYRYGHTTDPYSQWWACWQGSIHVCPQVEDPGSPYTWPTCGYPPSHPQG